MKKKLDSLNDTGMNRGGDDISSKLGDEELSNVDIRQILKNQKMLKEENKTLQEIIQDLKKRIKEIDANYNEKDD